GECEGMGQISMKISALPGSVLSENQQFQAARTQLEQLIHNNVDTKEKQEMLSLVKDMAAAMEAEQDIADSALRIGYTKRRSPTFRLRDFILGEVTVA
ncbi:hypothetical protein ACJRO0_14290, partial [Acetobacter oryzifermentans]|uniref:hypothetical protein n=1 Tax=Acetobacter oryzifermentans TaxID=1633874 RepID=UPI0039BF5D76